jgi:hypothetical protein
LTIIPKEKNIDTQVQYYIYKSNEEGTTINKQYINQHNILLELHKWKAPTGGTCWWYLKESVVTGVDGHTKEVTLNITAQIL